jgi:hypothetical protein
MTIEVLRDFANNIVEQERIEFLAALLEEHKREASKSEKSFRRGVAEALTGAALWTIILSGSKSTALPKRKPRSQTG